MRGHYDHGAAAFAPDEGRLFPSVLLPGQDAGYKRPDRSAQAVVAVRKACNEPGARGDRSRGEGQTILAARAPGETAGTGSVDEAQVVELRFESGAMITLVCWGRSGLTLLAMSACVAWPD